MTLYRHLPLLLCVLLLAACNPGTPVMSPPAADSPLFTDSMLAAATLETLELSESLALPQARPLPEGAEVTLPEAALSLAARPEGSDGYVAYIHYDAALANPWRLFLYDQETDTRTLVYAGGRELQSVAVSGDGQSLLFSMRDESDFFQIYRVTLGSRRAQRFTEGTYHSRNISMSASGRTLAWEFSPPGEQWHVIIVASYQYSSGFLSGLLLENGLEPLEPSVSANGRYLSYVKRLNETQQAVIRYDLSWYDMVTVHSGAAQTLLHTPSVSNDGSVAWAVTLRNGNHGLRLQRSDGTLVNLLTTAHRLEHPFLTADGRFLAYTFTQTDTAITRLRALELATNSFVNLAQAGAEGQLRGAFWQNLHRLPVSPVQLVRDIKPEGESLPWNLTAVDGTLFFTADDGTHGRELWRSDGSPAGTVMVRDIHPSSELYTSFSPQHLTAGNGLLFFTADDGMNGRELWRSNGLRGGTVMVRDIHPSGSSTPAALVTVGNTLYFTADDGVNGRELWRSNGTRAGTVMVKDIHPSGSSAPHGLTEMNGTLYFTANDGVNGRELWKSDGTSAGTVMVKNIRPGGAGADIERLINVNGTLYFAADDGTHGRELWKSDGSAAGTVMVKNITAGGGFTSIRSLANVGDMLFFTVYTLHNTTTLWKSDGSDAGTLPLKTFQAYSDDPLVSFTALNGTLYFIASGSELWQSNGTPTGTFRLTGTGISGNISSLTNVGGRLLFSARDALHGIELWESDGSAAGTRLLADINPGNECNDVVTQEPLCNSSPSNFTLVNDTLFFRAESAETGIELWKLPLGQP